MLLCYFHLFLSIQGSSLDAEKGKDTLKYIDDLKLPKSHPTASCILLNLHLKTREKQSLLRLVVPSENCEGEGATFQKLLHETRPKSEPHHTSTLAYTTAFSNQWYSLRWYETLKGF